MTRENALSVLSSMRKICDALPFRLILDGGTLLGATRNNDFCHDDHRDIDFTTLADWSCIGLLISECSKHCLYENCRFEPTETLTGQVSFARDGIKVDVMFKRLDRGFANWDVRCLGSSYVAHKSVQLDFYVAFTDRPRACIGVIDFDAPNRIQDYLTVRYGNWQRPVLNWDTYKHDGALNQVQPSMYHLGLTFGAFDCFHYGHAMLLRNAMQCCHSLRIGISTDERILKLKGRAPVQPYDTRAQTIRSLTGLDVFPVCMEGKQPHVEEHRPGCLLVGDDWLPAKYDGEGLGVPVLYLPHTPGCHTSNLRRILPEFVTE